MKRVAEKVKDIVEVRPFSPLHDLAADPSLTLSGYHFTDITADLMANWLDRIASVKSGRGAASAVAGFRGVGKSHFLAAVSAIVSTPELRSRIADEHVASHAGQLSRRHYPVVLVRRGSEASLVEELKVAVAAMLGSHASSLTDSLNDLLLKASEKCGDVPLVLLIDTAAGRESRVARDDGRVLSEIAEAAMKLGIFVGLALDDDISGADGANSSIAATFAIDYLDQEHLYKIVDSHIFAKQERMRPLLHEIYEDYRAALPGFRWSEQRFLSLYPLHPATLEIAPLIRLYIQDFALLGFASEAGVRILGRPANSLIGLDEIFDNVESRLRHVPDLADAFASFDLVDHEVVAKTPVKVRLQAKLVLKGLFMLSLDGQGATAHDIAASMMILENGTTVDVDGLLASFAEAFPAAVVRSGTNKYLFRIEQKEDINAALAEKAGSVSDEDLLKVLVRHTAEKFSDMEPPGESGSSACTVEWRGGIRRGEVVWEKQGRDATAAKKDHLDWRILAADTDVSPVVNAIPALHWKLAELTGDERRTIGRYHVLQTDAELREQFKDAVATASQIHSIAVERIWQRIFLNDAALVGPGGEYRFPADSSSAHTLSQLLTQALEPFFDASYPNHPEFARPLGTKETTSLVANFFGGAAAENSETQNLARGIAAPLGLAVEADDVLVPTPAEGLLALEVVQPVFGEGVSDEAMIPIADISSRLRAAPYGLTREAQHLVLAALVAQRQFDFITSSGNRINRRSLDLQILWDDITGIARPREEEYSPARLLFWVKSLTGNAALASLERTEDRLLAIDSLTDWLISWNKTNLIAEFDALPDDALTTAGWHAAAGVRKSFGATADAVDSLVANDISLDECLQTIAGLFADSEAEFEKKQAGLVSLKSFLETAALRGEVIAYLAVSELTDDAETEAIRAELLASMLDAPVLDAAAIANSWPRFKDGYAAYYSQRHTDAMTALAAGAGLNEVLASDEWSTFEALSTVPLFDRRYAAKAKAMVREARRARCSADTVKDLESRPFCSCNFGLKDLDRLSRLRNDLGQVIDGGLQAFRDRLTQAATIDPADRSLSELADRLAATTDVPALSADELHLLSKVSCDIPTYEGPSFLPDEEFSVDDTWFNTGQPVEASTGARR